MGRWLDRGGLDVGSGCIEGAAAESGGGRGDTMSRRRGVDASGERRG
jgi:hypothetical protein